MSRFECPSRDALTSFVLGELADAEVYPLAEHLDTCAICEDTVSDLERFRLLAAAEGPVAESRFVAESQCTDFVSALQNQLTRVRELPTDDGRRIGERIRDYEILEQIGQGGMGVVYCARHTQLNKQVALKLLPDALTHDQAAVARFQREMQAVGRLDHPNIVRAMDAGEVESTFFLVMELVDGVDLASLTSGNRRLDVGDACEIARQAAVALLYAHSQGAVHRDLKPSNLMLHQEADGTATVKLLDLGLATIQGVSSAPLTDNGQLMGTLEYMAPEQAENTHAVDGRADIYSLGAMLYRLLTGSVPFGGAEFDSPAKRLKALISSDPPSVASRRSDLPGDLVALLDRMLSRVPDDRPADLSEVVSVLQSHAQSHQLNRLISRAQKQAGSRVLRGAGSNAAEVTQQRPWRGTVMLAASVPLLLLLAAVIWLRTDGGYIRIENRDPTTPVWVEILKDGRLAGTVQVSAEQGEYWYRSGRYKLRLAAGTNDTLLIEENEFTLRRGGEAVVTITNAPEVSSRASAEASISQQSVAKWVLKRSGQLVIRGKGWVRDPDDIPDGPLKVDWIVLGNVDDRELFQFAEWLPLFPNCKYVMLYGGQADRMTDAAIPAIRSMTEIHSLGIFSRQITDQGLAKLTALPNLRSLTLGDTQVRKAGLESVRKNLPQLVELLIQSKVMSGDDLAPLAEMPNLSEVGLNLEGSDADTLLPLTYTKVTDVTLRESLTWHPEAAAVLRDMPRLRKLSLMNCGSFGDTDLLLVSKNPELRTLRIYQRTFVTAATLRRVLEANPDLNVEMGKPLADSVELLNHPQIVVSQEGLTTMSVPVTGR